MKKITPYIILFSLFISGCNDSEDNEAIISNSTPVVTNDIMESNFYYNLATQTEVDSASVWHISAQAKQVNFEGQLFGMPCIVLGNVYVQTSVYPFADLTVPPDQNSSEWFENNSDVEYGGDWAILDYNMTTHVVSVLEEITWIIYEGVGHTTYKVQFLDYTSGIVSFQFSEL